MEQDTLLQFTGVSSKHALPHAWGWCPQKAGTQEQQGSVQAGTPSAACTSPTLPACPGLLQQLQAAAQACINKAAQTKTEEQAFHTC